MAKRFTDTNKYKKEFMMGLKGPYKLLWDFLYHECDHAGIWIVNFQIAQIYIGADMKVNKVDALKYFNKGEIRVHEISPTKWFIPEFINFQYGDLDPKNRAHNSVIKILKSFNLIDEENKIKGLNTPLKGCKDKDMDKDKDKDMDKDKDKDSENFQKNSQTEIAVFDLPDPFIEIWDRWVKYKKDQHKFKYASKDSEETAKKSLLQLCEGDPDKATKILDYAIGNGYKGFFELKSNPGGQELSKEDKNKQSTVNAINILQKKYQEKQAV